MTDLRTNLTLAFQALSTQRLRAFLTILGLTMGVATLMAVITLILGANTFVADKVANLGTGVFRIAKTPFASTDWEENVRARRNPDIGLEHLRAIREACPLCEQVGATATARVAVRYRNQELRDVALNGYTPNMVDINTRTIERGRYFSSSEDRHAARVACWVESGRTVVYGRRSHRPLAARGTGRDARHRRLRTHWLGSRTRPGQLCRRSPHHFFQHAGEPPQPDA